MCATVPSTPAVLMVPLTDLSAAIEIVPVPDADVVTGGVSSAPVNFTFKSTAKTDPLNASAAVVTSAQILRMLNDLLMINSIALCFSCHLEWAALIRAQCSMVILQEFNAGNYWPRRRSGP